MDSEGGLTASFEANRARLVAIATRVLGSRADAEDVVQEAWLRLARQDAGAIDNVSAWLTTVVGRLSIDVLRARAAKAEVPYELHLGELTVAEDDDRDPDHADPQDLAAAQKGDIGALMEVLDPELTWEVHTRRGVTVRTGAQEILRVLERGDPTRIIARRVLVDGRPGIAGWAPNGQLVSVMACTVEHGRITKIASVVDRRALAHVDLPAVPE